MLTGADRRSIAQARELAALRTTAALRERFPGWDDLGATYAEAFGTARYLLRELAAIAERLGSAQSAQEGESQTDAEEPGGPP